MDGFRLLGKNSKKPKVFNNPLIAQLKMRGLILAGLRQNMVNSAAMADSCAVQKYTRFWNILS
jgi:hypothetical protein